MQNKSFQRHNRKHDPHPEWTARGHLVFNSRLGTGTASGLLDDEIRAALHYASGIIGLPNGGLRLKKTLKTEAKKRGLL